MRGLVFVVFVHCPALSPAFAVPVLRVSVPVSVVASYLPSRRSRSLPSMSFLDWVLSSLASRGVSLPSPPAWVFVRREVEVRRPLPPLPLVVLG